MKKIIEAIGFITIDDYEVEANEIRAILGDFKMYDYTLLENKFNPLLRLLSVILTDSELDECLLFVKAGEYGVAFEPLCVMLEETGKIIPQSVFQIISELGQHMQMNPASWERLKPLIQ